MMRKSSTTRFIDVIDNINRTAGHLIAWLALIMALTQFTVVILRYVFSIGSIQLQESIWYMHGMFFMLGAGYTLLKDQHVRLDVFYRNMNVKRQALINLLGSVLLLLPFCLSVWWLSWPFVETSWIVRETSMEVSGLPFLFLFKSVILIFCFFLASQGVALAIKSYYQLRGIVSTLNDGESYR